MKCSASARIKCDWREFGQQNRPAAARRPSGARQHVRPIRRAPSGRQVVPRSTARRRDEDQRRWPGAHSPRGRRSSRTRAELRFALGRPGVLMAERCSAAGRTTDRRSWHERNSQKVALGWVSTPRENGSQPRLGPASRWPWRWAAWPMSSGKPCKKRGRFDAIIGRVQAFRARTRPGTEVVDGDGTPRAFRSARGRPRSPGPSSRRRDSSSSPIAAHAFFGSTGHRGPKSAREPKNHVENRQRMPAPPAPSRAGAASSSTNWPIGTISVLLGHRDEIVGARPGRASGADSGAGSGPTAHL